jgi:hypothetical protein
MVGERDLSPTTHSFGLGDDQGVGQVGLSPEFSSQESSLSHFQSCGVAKSRKFYFLWAPLQKVAMDCGWQS